MFSTFELSNFLQLSQLFVLFGYLFLFATYYAKTRIWILIFNTIALINMGIGFILLGAFSGLAIVFISITRNIIFFIRDKKTSKNQDSSNKDTLLLLGLVLISAILTYFTSQSILGWLPFIAATLYTVSIWQKNIKIYRMLGVLSCSFWVVYQIYIQSPTGLIFEICLLLVILSSVILPARNDKTKI